MLQHVLRTASHEVAGNLTLILMRRLSDTFWCEPKIAKAWLVVHWQCWSKVEDLNMFKPMGKVIYNRHAHIYIYIPRPSKGWQMDSEIWCSEGVPNGHPFWPLRWFYLIWLIMSKLMRFILRLSNLGKYVWSSSTQIGAKTTRKWHVLEVPFGAWHVFKGVSISDPLHWRGVHLPPLALKGCPFAILFKTPLTRTWHGMTRAKYLCLCNLRCQLVVAYHGVGIWCTYWLSIKYLSNHDHTK